jgi:glucose-1-phosphate thymidylyltransferase
MKGLILAGGHGTRLRPLTFSGNKHMLPIANKPMLMYSIDNLKAANVTDIGIILGPLKEGIMESLGNGSSFGINLTYLEQSEPNGLAHAVKVARPFLKDDDFVMHLGDNILESGANQLVEAFQSGCYDCVIGVTSVKDPSSYGVVELKEGKIVRLVEKPKHFVSDLALVGVYVFSKKIHSAIDTIKPSWRNELEITDALEALLQSGARINVEHVKGWWKDAGRGEDLLDANRLVLSQMKSEIKGRVEDGASVVGNAVIGEGSVIKTGSKLLGPLIVGKNCTIGPNVYVGPYTSIGDGSIVEESEIENSILMENCKILKAGRVVDSLIGRQSTISSVNGLPRGKKMMIGEHTVLEL